MTTIAGWPEGLGLARFETLDSTNEEARRRAKLGERGPLWVVAREQTAGRGRRGRTWVSQRGNFFATFLTQAPGPHAAQLGLAAGLAAAEAVEHFATDAEVRLKWPNDVLIAGRKAGGILLEALGEDIVAVGIGLNLANYPSDAEFSATAIAAVTGRAPGPDEVLLRLATSMTAWYEIWSNEGFAPVRKAWLSRAGGLGSPLRARAAQGERQGLFETVDEDGALLLREAGGNLARITAADVFFAPPTDRPSPSPGISPGSAPPIKSGAGSPPQAEEETKGRPSDFSPPFTGEVA